MEETIYDLIVDELKERQALVKAELRERFKKTKPFRQEPLDDKEALLQYQQFTPEVETRWRQQVGDAIIDEYKGKMETIARRYLK